MTGPRGAYGEVSHNLETTTLDRLSILLPSLAVSRARSLFLSRSLLRSLPLVVTRYVSPTMTVTLAVSTSLCHTPSSLLFRGEQLALASSLLFRGEQLALARLHCEHRRARRCANGVVRAITTICSLLFLSLHHSPFICASLVRPFSPKPSLPPIPTSSPPFRFICSCPPTCTPARPSAHQHARTHAHTHTCALWSRAHIQPETLDTHT